MDCIATNPQQYYTYTRHNISAYRGATHTVSLNTSYLIHTLCKWHSSGNIVYAAISAHTAFLLQRCSQHSVLVTAMFSAHNAFLLYMQRRSQHTLRSWCKQTELSCYKW